MPRHIVVLGSTGSIGTQTLEVAGALPGEIQVVGLAAGSNVELLAAQIVKWRPEVAVLFDATRFSDLKRAVGNTKTKLLCGMEGLLEAATWPTCDVVLGAMMGAAGLKPTLAAIEAGKDVAIANKETLVAAGDIVMGAARQHNIKLWPVDSEHSALAQCLLGEDPESVEKLTITASGGPFWSRNRQQISLAKPDHALKHPTWTMGRKITIDSATLMNKGLEMIEACHLFGVEMDKIEVVVHRQSIVHSFVSFVDGSVKAQLGVPDMKLPIQWGLLGAERKRGDAPHLDLPSMGTLTFEPTDDARFPSINLAREAMKLGGTAPAALNAANEVAVEAFLQGGTGFYGVTSCVSHVLERHENCARPALADVLDADKTARERAFEWLRS